MPWRQPPPHDMQDTACRPAEPGCPVAAWVDAMTGFEQPAYVLALDGRFVWVNEACVGLFGRPAAELLLVLAREIGLDDAGREALQRSERQPWTASRTSTTRWATPPATRCWPPSARGCGSGCARATRWRGWAATSSSC